MKDIVKTAVLNAIGLLIRPLIRLALRNGITFREFMDLSKGLYVQVAAEGYGVNGRSTNISRIAMITGINRKDIKRLKDSMKQGVQALISHSPDRVARIISGWHQDPDFLDAHQQPILLNMEGEVSFTELVQRYGGDIAVVSLIKELKRSGVIVETEGNKLQILKRNYIPNPSANPDKCPGLIAPKSLIHASSILNDHINTIFHNLYRDDMNLPPRFERRATNHRVDKTVVPMFREYVETLGQEFLENIDKWLSLNEASQSALEEQCVRLGTGLYWIEGLTENITEAA